MHTVLVSFTSLFGMFLFKTVSDRDALIYYLATLRAKAHWSVWAPVIKVGALVSLRYHLFLLSIYDYELSRSSVIFSHNSLSLNLKIRIVHVRLSVLRGNIDPGWGSFSTNQRTPNPLLQYFSISS